MSSSKSGCEYSENFSYTKLSSDAAEFNYDFEYPKWSTGDEENACSYSYMQWSTSGADGESLILKPVSIFNFNWKFSFPNGYIPRERFLDPPPHLSYQFCTWV